MRPTQGKFSNDFSGRFFSSSIHSQTLSAPSLQTAPRGKAAGAAIYLAANLLQSLLALLEFWSLVAAVGVKFQQVCDLDGCTAIWVMDKAMQAAVAGKKTVRVAFIRYGQPNTVAYEVPVNGFAEALAAL